MILLYVSQVMWEGIPPTPSRTHRLLYPRRAVSVKYVKSGFVAHPSSRFAHNKSS